MIRTLLRLLWKEGNERRELPEATENRLQAQVGQRGRVAAKLVSQGFLWTNAGSLCRLQPLAQKQGHIVYGVHQSRCRSGSRFDSNPAKRTSRGQDAKPLYGRTDWVKRCEEYRCGCDTDSRSSCVRNYRKQAATKERLFDDRPKQRVEKNQVPQVDHLSGWSRGMGNNNLNPNSKPDSAHQGTSEMNSSGPTPSQTLPGATAVPESNDRVQRAD